ncbi:MAG: S8 family serine peptidase [Burkholderiaceae bacterium]
MTGKKRYLVQVPTHVRHAAGFVLDDVTAGIPGDRTVHQSKGGARVLMLDEAERDALLKAYPGLLIEEDQELRLLGSMPGLGFQLSDDAGRVLEFVVVDEKTDEPIAGVTLFAQGAHATYRADTGPDGRAAVTVFEAAIERVIVSPAAGYWSRVVAAPAAGTPGKAALAPLVPQGSAAWNRGLLGLDAQFPFRGQGVKVALIDSGIAEHPDLVVAGGVNTLDGEDPQAFRRDEKGHGTHCAGIVAGRGADAGVLGIAPDAEIFSVKVFPGGRLSDLVEGLQWAIDHRMDVVSMSLGLREPSAQLAMKLAEAAHQGIVLVAATGNDGSTLSHPAADEGVLGVGAFGSTQAFPPDSAHVLRVGALHDASSGFFVADFSNHGPRTAFIAPGVAIVSSVPGGYAAWDGTSMACPHITGLAALLLGAHPELATRNLQRVRSVHAMLAAGSADLGVAAEFQGSGMPRADRMLGELVGRHQATARLAVARQDDLSRLEPLIADLERQQQEILALLAQLD